MKNSQQLFNKLFRYYLVVAATLYASIILLVIKTPNQQLLNLDLNVGVQILSLLLFFSFTPYLYLLFSTKSDHINYSSLSVLYFVYVVPVTICIVSLLYYQTDSFFSYYGKDQFWYHEQGAKLLDYSLLVAIEVFLSHREFWDLGTVLFVRSLYLIWYNPLVVIITNVFVVYATVLLLYRVGKDIMDRKYAFVAALIYGISSFTIFMSITQSKESVFVLIVVLAFKYLYDFITKSNIRSIVYFGICLSIILFFRPPVVALIIFSLLISFVIARGKALTKLSLIGLSTLAFILILPQIFIAYSRFVGNLDAFLIASESVIIHSLPVTIVLGITSTIIGPLPSVVAINLSETVAYYSTGLLFRLATANFFIFACYKAIKDKDLIALPIVLFCLSESIVLGLILEGFELRKLMPHYPFIYLLVFYYAYKYRHEIINRYSTFNKMNKLYYPAVIIILIAWNYRYFI